MYFTFFCLITVLSSSHGLEDDDKFIIDIINSWDVDHCDLGYVSDGGRSSISNELIARMNDRPVVFKSIGGNESKIEILPNQNKCILQLLDFVSINRTKEFLKSAWSAGAIGATFFYLLKVEEKNQNELLMSKEIFDFKRLLVAIYSRRSTGIRLMRSPNEFATDEELFLTRTTWGPRKGIHILNNRFPGLYHNLRGKTLQIVMPDRANPIFANTWNFPDGSKIRSGLDFYALKYFSKALNFKFKITGADEWGSIIDENNSFNGMIGMVQRKEVHLAMGFITRTAMREKAVDFSYPYYITKVCFYTKKPSKVPNFMAILGPFRKLLWIALAIAVPAFSMVFFTLSKIDREGFLPNFHIGKVFMQVSQMLVNQGITQWPLTWKSRMPLTFWALFAFVMAYAYNGSLIAYLTYPSRSQAVNTFADILKQPEDTTLFVYKDSSQHKILQESSDQTLRDLNKRLQKQGPNRSHIVPQQYKSKTGSGVVPLILKSTSPVIWIHELSTKPALKNRYETLSGQTDLHYSKEEIYPSWYGYAMRDKAPFKEEIDKWIRRFSQFGLNLKWIEMAKYAHRNFYTALRELGKMPPLTVEHSDVPEIAPLNLEHLAGPMALHALVLALATLVWLAELCCGIWQKKRGNQVREMNRPILIVKPRRVQLQLQRLMGNNKV